MAYCRGANDALTRRTLKGAPSAELSRWLATSALPAHDEPAMAVALSGDGPDRGRHCRTARDPARADRDRWRRIRYPYHAVRRRSDDPRPAAGPVLARGADRRRAQEPHAHDGNTRALSPPLHSRARNSSRDLPGCCRPRAGDILDRDLGACPPGALDPVTMMRIAIPSVTMMLAGAEVLFSSFLLSLIDVRPAR